MKEDFANANNMYDYFDKKQKKLFFQICLKSPFSFLEPLLKSSVSNTLIESHFLFLGK